MSDKTMQVTVEELLRVLQAAELPLGQLTYLANGIEEIAQAAVRYVTCDQEPLGETDNPQVALAVLRSCDVPLLLTERGGKWQFRAATLFNVRPAPGVDQDKELERQKVLVDQAVRTAEVALELYGFMVRE